MGADGSVTQSLVNIQKLAAVCTYGADRLAICLMGDPPRRIVKRLLRATPGHSVSCDYLAHYNVDRLDATDPRRLPRKSAARIRSREDAPAQLFR